MIHVAHFVAISCYAAAAALAAAPLARPVRAPVNGVLGMLGAGVVAHGTALALLARESGAGALSGLGPALSFAAFTVALALLIVEAIARDVSLTLVAAPLAAVAATAGNIAGMRPFVDPGGARAAWLILHIVLAFAGLAAYATAAAAGTMYLVAHRDLKSRRFGAVFRAFPPLATLDRVNHVAAMGAFLVFTLGIGLAGAYSIAYRSLVVTQLVWGVAAWLGIAALALGRLSGRLPARRAAMVSALTFAFVLVLYVVVRLTTENRGQFL
jgi:HemX protein